MGNEREEMKGKTVKNSSKTLGSWYAHAQCARENFTAAQLLFHHASSTYA